MMLMPNHVKSNKAVSNVVVSILLIVVAVSLVFILFVSLKQVILKSPSTTCFDLMNSFNVKKACYFNNEVKIEIKRGFDNLDVEKLKFSFSPLDYMWELTGKKCSDVRIGNDYGKYCDIIQEGNSLNYIFNFSGLENQEKVKFAVFSGEELCFIDEKIIEKC